MKTYNVEFDQTIHYSCEVNASSEQAAVNKVRKASWEFHPVEEYTESTDNIIAEEVE